MNEVFLSGILILLGVIHVLPMAGLLGKERLSGLYAVSIADANIEILLRHRALLFGLLGAFFIYSAFRPDLQGLALAAAFLSLTSFVALALAIGGYNKNLSRVMAVDLGALALLVIGCVFFFMGGGA